MKKFRSVFFTLLSCLFLFSCVSTPENPRSTMPPSAASDSVQAIEPERDDGSADETLDANNDGSNGADEMAPDLAEVPDSTASAPATDAGTEIKPIGEAEVSPVPPVPSSEKLLYFYPEPEALAVVPVQPPKTEPPAPKQVIAPEIKPAPAKPVIAAKNATEKAPVKTSGAEKETPPESDASGSAQAEILPGIWNAEPSSAEVPPEKASAVPQIPRLPPSRQATIPAGQTLEIWYPGSGWVFLGDASAQNGLGYENRKLDKADTLFTFKALKPGSYILDFSRFDVLDDSFIQDSVAVTVTEQGTTRSGRIRAPDYRAASPALPATSPALPATVSGYSGQGTIPSPGGKSVPNVSVFSDEPTLSGATGVPSGTAIGSGSAIGSGNAGPSGQIDSAEILRKAETALASGDTNAAMGLLDAFFMSAVSSLDEGWYLRGKAYEANGASRDIRKALDAYQTLVSAYPESSRWKAADERIRYIKQFYLKIR